MNKLQLVLTVTIGTLLPFMTAHAGGQLTRGTALNAVLCQSVTTSGGPAPVSLRITGSGPLGSAVLQGQFVPKANAWVLVEFQNIILADGTVLPLAKAAVWDASGQKAIEVIQTDRNEWASFIGRGHIPAGAHFSLVLTSSLNVPSSSHGLALAR